MELGTHGSAAEEAARPDTDPESLLELQPIPAEEAPAVEEVISEPVVEPVVEPVAMVAVDESLTKP